MRRLRAFLRRRASRDVPRLEEALLGRRVSRYVRRRLGGFALGRSLRVFVHVLEFTLLVGAFGQRGLIASLAALNLAAAVDSFWWGALEVMRERLRAEPSKLVGTQEAERWLRRAVVLAGLAVALPIGVFASHWWIGERAHVLYAYALVCGLRLGIDLLLRTCYSNVYARNRVYRPVAAILVAESIGVVATTALYVAFGPWAFPLGLFASVLVSRGMLFHYTRRAHRAYRLPWPRLRLRAPGRAPVRAPRRVLLAGSASLLSRLGSTLVLAVIIPPLLQEGDVDIDPFAYVLHLSAPLLTVSISWSQLFYHDFTRLEGRGAAHLRRRLERMLLPIGALVALCAWAVTVLIAHQLVGLDVASPQLLSLLPVHLALAVLGAVQMRDFAGGRFGRLLLGSLLACATIVAAIRLDFTRGAPGLALFVAAGLLLAALAVRAWRGRVVPAQSGLIESFFSWLPALRREQGPVTVAALRVGSGARELRVIADRIVAHLGPRGAVTLLPEAQRLLWFERGAVLLDDLALARLGAGRLGRVRRLAPMRDGKAALTAAAAAGLLRPVDAPEPPEDSVIAEFRRRFPRGFHADIQRSAGDFDRLPPLERQEAWRDALRQARRGHHRSRSVLVVTSYRPRGEIEIVFAHARAEPLADRLAWRRWLEGLNWSGEVELNANAG